MTIFASDLHFLVILLSGVLAAAASGLVGSFLLLRRMTLLSDSLSHVALPGIALGVILKFNPILGGLAFLLLGTALIWGIEERTRLSIESITGVIFVTSLAVGALLIPETELLETFFGSIEKVTILQAATQGIFAILILVIGLWFLKPLVLSSIAPELAAAAHISDKITKLVFLGLVAGSITLGISFVGVLLTSALSIIPAASARNFSKTFTAFVFLSVAISIVALSTGLIISKFYAAISPGTATVLVGAFIFALSLLRKR